MISLIDLLGVFLFYTVITFGNGPVMLPLLDQALVQTRHVITSDQLLYAYAIARVTPGQINLYIAAIGYFLFGPIGAILSSISIIIPGFLMIPMMKGYQKFKNIPSINNLIKGITIASIGLIFSATASLGQSVLIDVIPWVVFITMILMAKLLKINGFICFILASILGVVLYFSPFNLTFNQLF